MTFYEYQISAMMTAIRHDNVSQLGELSRWTLGLAGESGEVADKVKKIYRDHKGEITPEVIRTLKKELGDVLWYIAMISDCLGFDINDVATYNVEKLAERTQKKTLHGDGDDR